MMKIQYVFFDQNGMSFNGQLIDGSDSDPSKDPKRSEIINAKDFPSTGSEAICPLNPYVGNPYVIVDGISQNRLDSLVIYEVSVHPIAREAFTCRGMITCVIPS